MSGPDDSPPEPRWGQILDVDPSTVDNGPPESITSVSTPGDNADRRYLPADLRLPALPVRGLKILALSFSLFVLVAACVEIYRTFSYALSLHWAIAAAFALALWLLLLVGAAVVLGYLRDHRSTENLGRIQKLAQSSAGDAQRAAVDALLEALDNYYRDKPQSRLWRASLADLPDYAAGQEVLDHIERTFISRLDREALRRVTRHSSMTGLAIATSPWMAMDMLLSLWRNLRMMEDIAQVYGLRPSLHNRLTLVRRVLHHMVVAGGTELLLGQAVEAIGGNSLAATLGARMSQGLGIGIYSARIGVVAMAYSRPVPFRQGEEPNLTQLAASIKRELTATR